MSGCARLSILGMSCQVCCAVLCTWFRTPCNTLCCIQHCAVSMYSVIPCTVLPQNTSYSLLHCAASCQRPAQCSECYCIVLHCSLFCQERTLTRGMIASTEFHTAVQQSAFVEFKSGNSWALYASSSFLNNSTASNSIASNSKPPTV